MAGFENVGYNPIGKGTVPQKNNNTDVYNQVMALKRSIPDVSTTKAEKEKAIEVKNKIIKIVKQQLEQASKCGDSIQVQELRNQIRILEGERDTIKSELQAMTNGTSIYNQEQNSASTKGADKVSIWTQQKA